MNQKVELTKYLIEKLNLISPSEKSFKAWIHSIWQNPRLKNNGGFRLTSKGFELFSKADIKFFEVLLDKTELNFDNKFILWLDNTFNCPFYITKQKVYFFSERPAVQLVLFSGNLQKYYQAHQRFAEKQLDKS